MKILGKEDEDNTQLDDSNSRSSVGGRQQDYLDFLNYYKDDDDIIVAQPDLETMEVKKVGFSATDYQKRWVAEGQPTDDFQTYDDRKETRGFKDFKTMSNTQRQQSEALKFGTVKGDDGLIYDREAIDETESDKLKRAMNDMFKQLDDQLKAEIEAEQEDDDEEAEQEDDDEDDDE